MRTRELLAEASDLARDARSDATTWDARILLAHALGLKNPLRLDPTASVDGEAEARFRAAWGRRIAGCPVQHLVGEWDFSGRAFRVDPRALIPRPETEALVENARREAPGARRILDAGTGSGVIAITLLLEAPEATAVGLDASIEALCLARENAATHGVLDRLRLLAADWAAPLGPAAFDLAVSNPPYLAVGEAAGLPATVRDHEPWPALFGGQDGLSAIRRLLDELPAILERDAPFLFEIGFGQAEAVEREIRGRRAWRFERIEPDLSGVARVVVARRTAPRSDEPTPQRPRIPPA